MAFNTKGRKQKIKIHRNEKDKEEIKRRRIIRRGNRCPKQNKEGNRKERT